MSSGFKTKGVTALPKQCCRSVNLFSSEAARRWPDQEALIDGDRALTWSELDQQSGRVCSTLLSHGARKGERVVLCARKSAAMIAALHGVLKAGGVCVPVDWASPPTRVQAIIEDAAPAAIVASGEMFTKLRLPSTTLRMSVSDSSEEALPWRQVMAADPVQEHIEVNDSDLAYLLYTSGSTGQPRGVMLTHQNVSAFATWAALEFKLGPCDRVASVAPLHFDLSTFDLYSTAWSGATLCIPPALHLAFPTRLTAWMAEEEITVMYTVPSLLAMMAERGSVRAKALAKLRLLLFAGEVCPPRVLATLLDLLPTVEFANLYGPTETNVCTFERIDRQLWDRSSPVSIGVPCQGTRILLLDDAEAEVAGKHQVGELLVSGPTVALGYWHDAGRSQARFVLRNGERWCRTGDYAEFDDAGRLLFHGRRDHMVKIYGHRVELGDVENALLRHPGVAEAVVVAVNEVLVAFARPCRIGVSSEELREHCAGQLPRYMVPSTINLIDKLPLLSTGKIDRLGLQRMAT
ncbi:MAG: amino acid adenylation domain-containing protein [Acidobacteria bacterium]|nr:amino acid adenylation domain-containing protein [Acidobacteriota bacterium]